MSKWNDLQEIWQEFYKFILLIYVQYQIMFKLLFVVFLIYLSFRVFSPKKIDANKVDILEGSDDEGFTDYEEVEWWQIMLNLL